MNATEERLRDALRTVGETIGPEDVPEPGFARRRRRASLSRPVMIAVAASAAVVAGSAAMGGAFSSGDTVRPLSPPSAAADPAQKVSVFMCGKTSANVSCGEQYATERQKQEIKRRLDALPQVRRVEFESRAEAARRFKKRFENSEVFPRMFKNGDIPESFRVTLVPGAADGVVQKAVLGLPGVDTVLVERH